MLFGDCPCCGCHMSNPLADDCPQWQRLACEFCGQMVWLFHSRIAPEAYTEEAFNAKFEVEEATKIVRPKNRSAYEARTGSHARLEEG